MTKSLFCSIAILILIFLAGCGTPPATPTTPTTSVATETDPLPTLTASAAADASSTPDVCSLPQLEAEVEKVHKHMREFDDASRLATFIPQTQLGDSIADLQRIRRAAEDEKVPGCLTNLQGFQIAHMNAVIDTLLLFMRSSTPLNFDCVEVQPNTEEEVACKSIAFAQQQHDQYLVELARLLGLTVVPATPAAVPSETTTPQP